jgi:T5SS/PEP-CTERM-associated repeat protein
LLGVLLALGRAEAGVAVWDSYSAGVFHDPQNWHPDAVPGTGDSAVFRFGATGVSLEDQVTTDQLLVRSGQTLHLDLGGFAYHAANPFRFADRIADPSLAITPGVVFGDDGFAGSRVAMTVTNGLLSGTTGMVGREGGTLATVTIGSGATWQSTDLLSVGGFLACGPYRDPCDPLDRTSAAASLFVSDGGRVESGQALIGGHLPDGIPVEDPLGLPQLVEPIGGAYVLGEESSWLTSGEMVIGRGGRGAFEVGDGATAALGSVSIGGPTLRHPSSGALGVWTGARLDVAGALVVGDGGAGQLSISQAALVTSGSAIVGRNASSASAVVGDDSFWLVEETLTVGSGGTGFLQIYGGGVVATERLAVAEATGSVAKIELAESGSALHAAHEVTLGGEGSATVSLRGGNLVAPRLTVAAGSSIDGVGALLGDVTVHGEIGTQLAESTFPEPATDVLAIDGDLVLSPQGTFAIVLDGDRTRPAELFVFGTATLMGSVAVLLDEAARNALSYGDDFDVLEAAQILDAGWHALLPALDGPLRFELEIVARGGGREALRLVVIPEPGTAGLLVLGVLALAARRARYA